MPKSLTITADDPIFAKAVAALCFHGGADEAADEETRLRFAQDELLRFIGECIQSMEMKKVQHVLEQQRQVAAEAIAKANSAAREAVQFEVS